MATKLKKAEKVVRTSQTSVTLSEGVTAKKMQSELQKFRIQANKDYKTAEGSLSKMLKNYIEFSSFHLNELNKKNGTNITPKFILNCIESGKVGLNTFTQYLTEKETAQTNKKAELLGKNTPIFTFWLVQGLISRYSEANKVKPTKVSK